MIFNTHSNLEGRHAFLSPSKYHWINYDISTLITTYENFQAIQRGTEMHALAAMLIKLGVKLPSRSKNSFNSYVNDAIAYKMKPEQPLYFSDNCFGTCDSISFEDNFLRIHDLKTGKSKVSMHQLEVYDAIFCLEYRIDPRTIDIENRIYQLTEIMVGNPPGELIRELMNKIVEFDKQIDILKSKE